MIDKQINELEARTIEEDIKVIDAVRADMKELEKHLSGEFELRTEAINRRIDTMTKSLEKRIRDIEIKLGRWIQTTDSNQDRIGMLETGTKS